MKMHKRTRWVAAGLVAASLAAAGCSHQLGDQGGVAQANADYEVTVLNVDNFPNVTVLCIMGAGFASTTKDLNSLIRVPEWDAFCAKQYTSLHVIPGTGTVHPNGTASPSSANAEESQK